MLLFGRESWARHRSWAILVAVLTTGALTWYLLEGFSHGRWRWPGGASRPGFVFGVVGGAVIAFEMLLWPRKVFRRYRLGRTQVWLRAHLWLGILSVPLLLLHGSFHFTLTRSTLAGVLMWLLLVVVVSGIAGAAFQNVIPRLMLRHIPAETILGQIDHVLGLYRDEAARLVQVTSGTEQDDERAIQPAEPGLLVTESLRKVGRTQGKVVDSALVARWVPDSEPLKTFYDRLVARYLDARTGRGMPLDDPARAEALFQELKNRLRREAHSVVDRIASLCEQRRQFDLQRRLSRWLHGWLAIHFAISLALFMLMLAHAVLALRYL
jgi:hypothetical protein